MVRLDESGESWCFDEARPAKARSSPRGVAVENIERLERSALVKVDGPARLRRWRADLFLTPEFAEQVLARPLANRAHFPGDELDEVLVGSDRINAFVHLVERFDKRREGFERQRSVAFEGDLDFPGLIFVSAHE